MSSRKEMIALMEDERQRRYDWQIKCERASRQLYDEGKIGHWVTNEEFWVRERKINTRAHEIEEMEQYEKLKKKCD